MTESENRLTESDSDFEIEIEQIEQGEGNTRPRPKKKKKQVVASKRWCFTWNNYKTDTIEQIVHSLRILRGEIFWIIGRENCEVK